MYSQTFMLPIFVAMSEARFGQEQIPIPAISALTAFGNSGEASTLAGQSISFLLAAANPCGKLSHADKIVTALGTDPKVIAAARSLVAAEQNFNPFLVSIPSVCDDATLPATQELRGVVPLVDPAVSGSDNENSNSGKSLTAPFDATGLSVGEVMAAQGFANFTTQAADSTIGDTPAAGIGGVAAATPVASTVNAVSSATPACAPSTFVTMTGTAVTDAVTGNFAGFVASSITGLDFGLCTPTIKFEAGLNGRKETEFTFQAIDPVVNKGQQEALNPNIITNRICDQLSNVCAANADAKTACISAKAAISTLETRDKTTADKWNESLGFAGTDTNPDQAPKAGLVGHT
ncbi:hypothetical protein QTJ16_006999 [Diplocarpon rosae]|uniref:Uncharacterized protein n=1 Tax=Diplocarpon rosae TaxID=946125 RepID=A0AAD9SVA9_9HELO|nr:hypothetical protein QTJ16_006999 [Diplocarpon rosae]